MQKILKFYFLCHFKSPYYTNKSAMYQFLLLHLYKLLMMYYIQLSLYVYLSKYLSCYLANYQSYA